MLQRCINAGLVGGEGFAVDASLIQADASDRNPVEGAAGLPPDAALRSMNISPSSTMPRSARQAR